MNQSQQLPTKPITRELPPIQHQQITQPRQQETSKVSISALVEYLDEPPEEAYQALKEAYPEWLSLLKQMSAEELIVQVKQFRETSPEVAQVIDRLEAKEGRKWLESLLKLAKTVEND